MNNLDSEPLRFGLSERILSSLCDVFAQFPQIESVLVYGSRANSSYRSSSDIDLAVIAPTMTEREFSRLWSALDDLTILFKLDIVLFDSHSNAALKRNIIADSVVLYRSMAVNAAP